MEKRKNSFWKKCVFAVLPALFLAGTVPAAKAELSGKADFQIIAHRAGAALGPENTLAALEHSIAAGAEMAEIDVRLTRDEVLAAVHDENLSRTTGIDKGISETLWTELEAVEAGAWFSPQFAGEPVPTLSDFLTAAKGRIRLMVEIKSAPNAKAAAVQALEAIRAADMTSGCILGCGDAEVLRLSKALAPELETVYIGAVEDPSMFSLPWADSFSLPLKGLTPALVRQCQAHGKPVWVWTVNTRPEMEAALACGADGLVTNDPVLARRLPG